MRPGAAVASLAAFASAVAGLAGCGGRGAKARKPVDPVARAARQMQKDVSSITAQGTDNTFTVDDADGKPMLKAVTAKMEGSFKPGEGMQGPMKLKGVKALLYQKGKPQMNLESSEATWDGKFLKTDKPAHAVLTDGGTIIDAQKAVWTASTGNLALESAKMQSMKQGKMDFQAEAPKAQVEKQVATMPVGAVARNPGGQQLTANHMRWNMSSGRLEANGNVVVKDENTQVYGQRLKSDTKLRKGRLTGGTRIRMQKTPISVKNG